MLISGDSVIDKFLCLPVEFKSIDNVIGTALAVENVFIVLTDDNTKQFTFIEEVIDSHPFVMGGFIFEVETLASEFLFGEFNSET